MATSVTISGTGELNNSIVSSNISGTTTAVIIVGFTSIGVEAFFARTSLTSITIPNTVTIINNGAFKRCAGLTSITIPNSVTSINMEAFIDCSGLLSIAIPGSVTSIDTRVFKRCSSLSSITIPNSVTSIGLEAFQDCRSLSSITIPNSVISIGPGAFRRCSNLSSITIPVGVTIIDTGVFFECTSLSSITIPPDSVTIIGEGAFGGCSSLSSITIPVGVTVISLSAFENCTNLSSITIPNTVTSIGDSVFNGCSSLLSITIPVGVTIISGLTFSFCTSLSSVTIPDSVTSIGDGAFYNCTSLSSITIPNSVTSIIDYAFYGCTSLSSITIPDSVTIIGEGAFETSGLTSLYLTASNGLDITFPQNNPQGFYGATNVNIYELQQLELDLLSTFITTDQNNAYGTGSNHFGMLALGILDSSVNTLTNIDLPAGKTISKISSGAYFAMFLMTDGTLYGVGKNSNGELGLGHNNSEIRSLTQVSIPSGKIIKNISCGSYYFVVLMTDGTLYGTGYNEFGQLGLGDNINKNVLTKITIPPLKTIKTVLAGNNHTIVLMTDGTLYGSGSNGYGQLGLGSAPSVSVFTQIPPPNGKIIKSVSCGGNSVIVLMTDNTLYVTGKNSNGQLGIAQDNKTDIYVLTQPDTTFQAGKTIQTIFGGSFSTIITMTDNTVYGAGIGNLLGLSDSNDRTVFTLLSMPTNKIMQTVAGGNAHNIFLMKDGTLYGSGNNSYGQLGLGNNNNRTVLTQITVPNNEFVTSIMNDNRDLNIVCFKEDTKILTNNGYIPIQYLRPGDLVKTFTNGYLPISMIGVSKMHHSKNNKIAKNALYKCTNAKFPEVFEDLIITGCHGILVDNFANDAQIEQTRNVLGNIFITDKKYRLPACLDDRAVLYEKYGTFNIYHIALENPNYYTNYGIYANGLLVETCSKRYLKELSSMELLE